MALMAHYNGDVEGRLDYMLVLKALVLCACYVLKLPIWCVIGQKNLCAKNLVLHCFSWLAYSLGTKIEMYRKIYRNFTAIFRNFPQFSLILLQFFHAWGTAIPPPPAEVT